MGPDLRVPEMRDDLYGAVAKLVATKYKFFHRKYRISDAHEKTVRVNFDIRFNVALRHAFRKIEEERGEKPKVSFLHMICGKRFHTEEELSKHLQQGCKPSKRNQQAFAAQERILLRKKARHG